MASCASFCLPSNPAMALVGYLFIYSSASSSVAPTYIPCICSYCDTYISNGYLSITCVSIDGLKWMTLSVSSSQIVTDPLSLLEKTIELSNTNVTFLSPAKFNVSRTVALFI